MSNSRSGMTLVEVLVSLVLLAMLSAACAGLLQSVTRSAEAAPRDITIELDRFADELLRSPQSFGVDMPIHTMSEQWIPWPDAPDRTSVHIRVLLANDPAANHAWVVFECESWSVSRWLALPEEQSK